MLARSCAKNCSERLGQGRETSALHRVMLPWGCCGALTDTLLHSTRTVSRVICLDFDGLSQVGANDVLNIIS